MIDEGTGRGIGTLAAPEERMRLDIVETPVGQQSYKLSRIEILTERRKAGNGDTKTGTHSAYGDFGSIDRHLALRNYRDPSIVPMKYQFLSSHWSGDDEHMGAKIFRRLGSAIRFKIDWRRDHDERPSPDQSCDCAGVRQLTEPDRDIDPLLDQVLPPIVDRQLYL